MENMKSQELMQKVEVQTDTMVRRKAVRDSLVRIEPDTTRVPIGFDVEVEDWDEKVIEL